MTFSRRNWRGNFGSAMRDVREQYGSSARSNKYLRKIEQVNRFEAVLKSSAPKDTEVNASMAQRIFDPKPKPLR